MKQLLLVTFMVGLSCWLGWPTLPVRYPGPPQYLAFASEPIPTDRVKETARRYNGNVLIGVDANSDYANTLLAARQASARLHVYLEGPGGSTGESWTPDEKERCQEAARRVGILDKEWQTRWDEGGWKVWTFMQLRRFKSEGFESAEVDNLQRVVPSLLDFYQEYASWWQRGLVPRLMLKNLDEPSMRAVVDAVKAGKLPREMLADFAVFETSAGDPTGTTKVASELGIVTVTSTNTYDYAAFGPYTPAGK